VPAPGDYDDGEIGGMIGRGNRSTRRKPDPVPLCPPQTPQVCPDANPGRRGGKPATNRLNYGIANLLGHSPSSKANYCSATSDIFGILWHQEFKNKIKKINI
jgi:hypothetical protein